MADSIDLFPIVEVLPAETFDKVDVTRSGYQTNYNSYSGADITATILVPNEKSPLVLGDLQTLSYSIHRESKPVRLLGHVNPLGFVNGPRCLPANTKILVKDKGLVSIIDVEEGDYVQSSGFTYDKVIGTFSQGFKECYKLRLQDGYEITASYDHPIYTQRGWVEIRDLVSEDEVFVAAYAPSPEEEYSISDEVLKMLAYLIGDGTTHRYENQNGSIEHRIGLAISYNELDSIGKDSEEILSTLKIPFRDHESSHGGCLSRTISPCLEGFAKTDRTLRKYNDLHKTLLAFEMYDHYSYNKFIPANLLSGLNKRQIRLFLRHLFATDGGYIISEDRLRVKYTSTSEELIDEIRVLLLKLGIRASKRVESKVGKTGGREGIISNHDAYYLDIDKNVDVLKFYNRIGIFGKDDRVKNLVSTLKLRNRTKPLDIDSRTFLLKAQEAILRKGLRVRDFKQHNIYNYNLESIYPAKAMRLADLIGDACFTEYVNKLIEDIGLKDSSLVSVKIDSIKKHCSLPVYDLEVENRHSFIADLIKVHNTIGGSMIFINFEVYTFYRLQQYQKLIAGSIGTGRAPMFPLADMLPPFDVVITASNEYGSFSRMKILGVQIVDEGGVMSIEDLVTENTYTFMARGIEPWTPFSPEATIEKSTLPITSVRGQGLG